MLLFFFLFFLFFFVFQAEDGIRDLVRSRGLGDVYKRQPKYCPGLCSSRRPFPELVSRAGRGLVEDLFAPSRFVQADAGGGADAGGTNTDRQDSWLLYPSDAADEGSRVKLGGRRVIKNKNKHRK